MSKGFASSYRLVLVATTILVGFVGVGARLVHLHVLDRERLVSYVNRARRTVETDQARRGDIVDAKGDVLATSRTLVELAVDPWALVEYIEQTEKRSVDQAVLIESIERNKRLELARILDLAPAEVESYWTPGYRDNRVKSRWVKLHDGVAESVFNQLTAIDVSELGPEATRHYDSNHGLPRGLTVRRMYQRVYPRKQLAAHIIGFVNQEDQPSGGVEAFADFYLRGQDGWTESEKDGRRREMAQFRTREVPAADGFSVMLSIDSVVQHLIESELTRIATEYQPQKASIIVTDAESGFILGMGNYPTFDLNAYGSAPMEVQRNVAVTDLLDPGSTFKIVAASGALEEGLVTPRTLFNCSIDSIEYRGRERRFMPDDHVYDHPLSVSEIISHSSNIGAAQLGMKLGERGLYDFARKFGFGEKSGFPLGYESQGLLNTPDKWSALEITRIPAGYSISATPLQIHYAMATIASGGELLQPQLVREIRDLNGEAIYNLGGIVRRRVMQERVAGQMARMLMGVTEDGTAKAAAIPGYQIAGKTGTAQKLVDGRYSKKHHVGSFVGFFPATDPKVVVTVIVDDARVTTGSRVNYGSVVAVPTFRRVAERLISYLDIKPVDDSNSSQLALEGGRR
ncbi:peptidoglycan D,D-transpeptidase FtsI family protein [Synoicihabitans lomoniglobus]|uniref:Penicillin-binding protein 2 n=1 Tax=Synoicihabitans lomoniglobus TaxID=2909285 RepID=A0AAF0I3W1_9BACT|nr:penicillin-binding protein 2 [Opitutaceae bacterium LMO-M01]WED66150.1 penicillin-binding protein 2 [Opitutaceae bacterium LMO-M01]